MPRRNRSVGCLKVCQKARILEQFVILGVMLASEKRFPEMQEFIKKKLKLGGRVEDNTLSQLFGQAVALRETDITLEHKLLILEEHNKLNGKRYTPAGNLHLRCFAARKLGVIIHEALMERIILRPVATLADGLAKAEDIRATNVALWQGQRADIRPAMARAKGAIYQG